MEDLLRVGVITATHGIRGEVKVFPTTDDPQRFKKLKQCVIEGRRENIELEVQSVKFFKQYVIIKFKGYDSINDIEQFVKKDLMVTREHAVKCGAGRIFYLRFNRTGCCYGYRHEPWEADRSAGNRCKQCL